MKNVANYEDTKMTLPLFFINSTNLSLKQRASMLLTLKLSSFPTAPRKNLALRLQGAVPMRKQ